jgi:hypothetical protein
MTGAVMSGSMLAPAMFSGQSNAVPAVHHCRMQSDAMFSGPTVHHVQLLAAICILTGVGVSSDDVLEDLLEGLIPEVPLSRGHITIVDPLLARPTTRWGSILGSLLVLLADALRELDDLATFHGAMATIGVHRA